MKWVLPLLVATLAVVRLGLAAEEDEQPIMLQGIPNCAVDCLSNAITKFHCNASDTACSCNRETVIPEVSTCIAHVCTVREQLTTQNTTWTHCEFPIRNKKAKFINVTIVLGVLTAVIIILRVFSKFYITNSDFGLDDLFIFITFVVGLPSTIMNCVGTGANGQGLDVWTLDFDTITRFGYFFYILEIMYFCQVALLKMSLLFFYIRIFMGDAQKWLWGTVVFNAVYFFAFLFLAAFQCQPVSHFWLKWDGTHKGSCMNINAIGWAHAAISVALDVWMLAIPLWELRKLNLHWKKKIGVAAMFVVGTFVTIVSIIRLQFLVDLGSSTNSTYDQADVAVWSTVEINIGITCACMPALRILLVRLFPVLGGSSHDASKYQHYGENYGRKSKVSRSRSHALVELPSRGESVETPDHGGIEMKRTFRVQYSEGDEASLVAQRQGFGTNKGHVGHGSAAASGISQSEVSL